jgi:hypothetical protein
MLGMYTKHYVAAIATGDKSWFQYSSYSDSMFVNSRESALPRIRQDISGENTMITIFFRTTRLLVLEATPKDTKFNPGYFIHAIFPGLHNETTRISRKKGFPVVFSLHGQFDVS